MRPRRVRVREDPPQAQIPGSAPAVNCYFVALARSTSCDEATKDLSLFQLVTTAKHFLPEFGYASSYTSVFLLESATTGFDIEVRGAWKAHSPEAPFEPAEESTRITIQCPRMYLRKSLTRLPASPGVYDLVLDWRPIGSSWRRASARYPVSFEEKV